MLGDGADAPDVVEQPVSTTAAIAVAATARLHDRAPRLVRAPTVTPVIPVMNFTWMIVCLVAGNSTNAAPVVGVESITPSHGSRMCSFVR